MKYSALPNDDAETPKAETSFRRSNLTYHVLFLTVAYSLLAGWTAWLYFHSGNEVQSPKVNLYTPMQIPEEYEFVVWDLDTTNRNNIFMGGNTPERLDAWHAFSRKGPSLLSAEEASQLLEPTAEWIGEAKNSYVAGAEVFHNLHCLETLRTAIWAEEPYLFHGKEDAQDPHVDHMMHCIEYLRLALTCHPDTRMIPVTRDGPWYRDLSGTTTRVCRKFEPFVKWAEDHGVLDTPEFKYHVGSVIDGPSNNSILRKPGVVIFE